MTAWKKLGITKVKDGRKTFEAGGRLLTEKDYGWGTVVVDTGALGGSTHLYQQAADALLKTQAKYPTGLLEGQTAEAELKALPGMLEEKKKKDALAMEAYRQELGLAGGLTDQALEDDYQKAKATLQRPFNPNAPGKRLKAAGNASTFKAVPAEAQAVPAEVTTAATADSIIQQAEESPLAQLLPGVKPSMKELSDTFSVYQDGGKYYRRKGDREPVELSRAELQRYLRELMK